VAKTQLNLFQQFGRFLLIGALVFTAVFWGASTILISGPEAHQYMSVVRQILKNALHQSFAVWLRDLETGYVPFFLRQRSLLACYMIASSFAWLTAFAFDGRILRKEHTL
jgi:hypothetical protein